MKGTADGVFTPDGTVTKAELAQILGYNLDPDQEINFSDVSSEDWFYEQPVKWVIQYDMMSGYDDGTFHSEHQVTREEMAQVFFNVAKAYGIAKEDDVSELTFSDLNSIAPECRTAVGWCVKSKIINGRPNGTFGFHGTSTRAEIAKMLAVYMAIAKR